MKLKYAILRACVVSVRVHFRWRHAADELHCCMLTTIEACWEIQDQQKHSMCHSLRGYSVGYGAMIDGDDV